MFNLGDFPLPFRETNMEPYMSAETIRIHYGKHLATYIANLNKLIDGTKYADMDLHEIIVNSATNVADEKIFNNAAQVFNHEFFFNCLGRGNNMTPDIISDAFGGIAEFKEKFKSVANSVFGSGWVWLTHDKTTGFEISLDYFSCVAVVLLFWKMFCRKLLWNCATIQIIILPVTGFAVTKNLLHW